MSRQELKRRAREQLGGRLFGNKWIMALLISLVSSIIVSALSLPGAISNIAANVQSIAEGGSPVPTQISFFTGIGPLATFVLSGPLNYGLTRLFLKQARDGEQMVFTDLFKGFTEDFVGTFLIRFLTGLFTFLWSLLLFIPGIIKSLSYSMAYYVKVDHPDYDWEACVDESKRLMQGHKGELFELDLSFIGWYIVGMLCFGIGVLWVEPYHQATRAQFYQALVLAEAPAVNPADAAWMPEAPQE